MNKKEPKKSQFDPDFFFTGIRKARNGRKVTEAENELNKVIWSWMADYTKTPADAIKMLTLALQDMKEWKGMFTTHNDEIEKFYNEYKTQKTGA